MRILYNARILTQNTAQPGATALALEGETILAVGTDADMLALARPGCSQENMQGLTIWPGLTDAHLHLDYYSLALERIDCETATRAECLHRVTERARQTPPDQWVLGHGWNQNVWPEGFGSVHQLDASAPQNPVFLTAKSLHAAWVNHAALHLAGIDETTPDPVGGRLGRNAQGQLDGILYESAMELVDKVIPARTVEQTAAGIATAQANLWRMGVTSVHDFDQARCFSALQLLHQNEQLKLRVVKSIPLDLLPHAVALGLRSGYGDDWLRIGSVKCFADGALGPQTAAMLQGYENNPQNTGLLFMDAEQFYEIGQQAAASGLSLAIHAIGDRANHVVIDAYAQLRQYETQQHLPHLRHRIEHVQVLHPQDLPRLAEHQIIASVQPIHATSDMLIAERYWGARSQGAYAFRSLLDSGARLAFGSDAPVEAPNPFWGIHAAVTRCRPNGDPDPQGWYPQQKLSLQQALAAYTTGPAYAGGMEDRLGQLAPGYLADLIVLSSNPFDLPPSTLHTLQPTAVMVGGQWVLRN